MADDVQVDERVAAALRQAARAVGGVVSDLAILPGGHSGVTVSAVLAVPGGADRRIVVKASPPGREPVGRHDVLRQSVVLDALQGVPGVAAPQVLLRHRGDPGLFAVPFVEGDGREPVLDGTDATPDEVGGRALAAARMLAGLHAAPLDVPGLREEPALSVPDELDRWQKLMDAVPAELRPDAGDLVALLRSTRPDPLDVVLLHGDYRLGNLLCVGTEVRAVIDWEIWSVGDPRVDLGWFRLFCDAANFPGASTEAEGLPDPADLLAEYERQRGVAMPEMAWFDAFAGYKMAAIMGYNLRRHREGRHHDPYQETLVPTILHLVDLGLERLKGRQHAA
jgi:aminoglycoside phosphotransferase (APT) family kinase protein